ncbi:MAG: MFS transporter [Rhodospirillaceae bacterium]|nr:MFS transporter [Rhodospirillaceae bacterium]
MAIARDRTDGPASPVDGRYACFRLALSVLLGTIGSIGMWAVVVILPAVQAEFGVDRAGASVPFTFMMFGFAFGNLVGGRYVDRLGIVPPVIAAALALGLGFTLAAQADSIWLFSTIHGVLIGVGTAICFGPLLANISHWFERRRGIAVAAVASGNYIAGAIWPTILQGFVESDGWRVTYTGMGIMCVVTMVPLALLLRRKAPSEIEAAENNGVHSIPPSHIIDLSPRALRLLLAIAGIACCVAMSMPQVHIVAYCADLGYGVARGAEMLSLMLFAGIFSCLASGFLADYIGGVRTLLLGSFLQLLALLFYLPYDGLMSLYVISFMFGLAQGGIIPSYAIIIRQYLPAREAGRSIGLVIMATILGMALGGWLSGWIYDVTGAYRVAFINGIGWNVLNLGVIALILWRTVRFRTITA